MEQREQLVQWLEHVRQLLREILHLERTRDAILATNAPPYLGHAQRWRGGEFIALAAVVYTGCFLVAGMALSVADGARTDDDRWGSAAYVGGVLFWPAVAATAITAVLVTLHNRRVPGLNRRRDEINQARYMDLVEAVRPQTAPIEARMAELAATYQRDVGSHYPPAYVHDEAVSFFIDAVRNHRASTLSEAVNLYETELHRRRLENIAHAQLVEQQRATQVARTNGVINAFGHFATASMVRTRTWR